MKIRLNKGFTLIELLVVIAIIGILSGIVLTSLNRARDKANDASARTSLKAIKVPAEMYWDTKQAYTSTTAPLTVCVDTDVAKLLLATKDQTGNTAVCYATAGAYAASIQLNSGQIFCIDSTGTAKLGVTVQGDTASVCPTTSPSTSPSTPGVVSYSAPAFSYNAGGTSHRLYLIFNNDGKIISIAPEPNNANCYRFTYVVTNLCMAKSYASGSTCGIYLQLIPYSYGRCIAKVVYQVGNSTVTKYFESSGTINMETIKEISSISPVSSLNSSSINQMANVLQARDSSRPSLNKQKTL